MKYIILALFFILTALKPAGAEEIVKVLMLDNEHTALPSEDARVVRHADGQVHINGCMYEGSIDILQDEKGLYVIKHYPLEKYIELIIAGEVDNDWDIDAIKAQAVVARTFTLFYKMLSNAQPYHVTSGTLPESQNSIPIHPLVKYAVQVTKGEVLTYAHSPIKAFYHRACEGNTELPLEVWGEDYAYLRSVSCNSGESPFASWQRRFSLKEVARSTGLDAVSALFVSSRTDTGRVRTLTLMYRDADNNVQSKTVRATEFRNALGPKKLPSTDFSISLKDREVLFVGKGSGHGVGFSQWGALQMSRNGKNYNEILSHYYPGTDLMNTEEVIYRAKAKEKTSLP